MEWMCALGERGSASGLLYDFFSVGRRLILLAERTEFFAAMLKSTSRINGKR